MTKLKVLVAEDDPSTLVQIDELCKLQGISIEVTKDVPEAARLANGEKFHGVLMRLLTDKSLDLIRQIRLSSCNRHTPVIVWGPYDTQTRLRAFETGATFFLPEPLDRRRLTGLLEAARGTIVEERRRSVRIPFSHEVTYSMGGNTRVSVSSNLSREGILFQSDGSATRGRLVELEFPLEQGKPPIRAKGVVMRVDDKQRIAVRFVPAGPKDAELLRDFIAKEAEKQ
jgi:CheY-like chemotaxis protein